MRAEVRSLVTIRSEIAAIKEVVSVACSTPVGTTASNHLGNLAQYDEAFTAATLEASNVTTANSSTFATVATKLQQSGVKELLKVRKLRPVVVGRASNSKLKTVITKREVDMFVSRLHPSTTADDLRVNVADIFDSISVDKIDCVKLHSKYEELYSSFHVCVRVNVADFKCAIDLLNNSESWPDGTLVRRYFRPKHGEPTRSA